MRQDLLDADPWQNSTIPHKPAAATLASAADNFYSLDLNSELTSSTMSSEAAMDDSYVSTTSHFPSSQKGVELGARGGATVHRRCLEEDLFSEAIALHEGVGLQQLSQTPSPAHKPPAPQQPPPHRPHPKPSPPLSCKATLTLNGVTLALLEADPSHIYTPATVKEDGGGWCAAAGAEASMDEGGLDPTKYFEIVSELLKEGVNEHQLTSNQQQLSQILPADHLM